MLVPAPGALDDHRVNAWRLRYRPPVRAAGQRTPRCRRSGRSPAAVYRTGRPAAVGPATRHTPAARQGRQCPGPRQRAGSGRQAGQATLAAYLRRGCRALDPWPHLPRSGTPPAPFPADPCPPGSAPRDPGAVRKPWVKTTLAPGSRLVTDHYERAGLVPTWTSSGSAWSATAAARASGTSGRRRPRSARRSARRTCPWYRCSGRCVSRPAGRSESAEEVRVRDRAAVRGPGLPGAVRLDPPHPRVRARR
jgi:hypothetical protein